MVRRHRLPSSPSSACSMWTIRMMVPWKSCTHQSLRNETTCCRRSGKRRRPHREPTLLQPALFPAPTHLPLPSPHPRTLTLHCVRAVLRRPSSSLPLLSLKRSSSPSPPPPQRTTLWPPALPLRLLVGAGAGGDEACCARALGYASPSRAHVVVLHHSPLHLLSRTPCFLSVRWFYPRPPTLLLHPVAQLGRPAARNSRVVLDEDDFGGGTSADSASDMEDGTPLQRLAKAALPPLAPNVSRITLDVIFAASSPLCTVVCTSLLCPVLLFCHYSCFVCSLVDTSWWP